MLSRARGAPGGRRELEDPFGNALLRIAVRVTTVRSLPCCGGKPILVGRTRDGQHRGVFEAPFN